MSWKTRAKISKTKKTILLEWKEENQKLCDSAQGKGHLVNWWFMALQFNSNFPSEKKLWWKKTSRRVGRLECQVLLKGLSCLAKKLQSKKYLTYITTKLHSLISGESKKRRKMIDGVNVLQIFRKKMIIPFWGNYLMLYTKIIINTVKFNQHTNNSYVFIISLFYKWRDLHLDIF